GTVAHDGVQRRDGAQRMKGGATAAPQRVWVAVSAVVVALAVPVFAAGVVGPPVTGDLAGLGGLARQFPRGRSGRAAVALVGGGVLVGEAAEAVPLPRPEAPPAVGARPAVVQLPLPGGEPFDDPRPSELVAAEAAALDVVDDVVVPYLDRDRVAGAVQFRL